MTIANVLALSGDDVFQSTTWNIAIPSGIAVGDLMLLTINFQTTQNSAGTVSVAGSTSGTPWTDMALPSNAGGGFTQWVFYKVADAGDAADSLAGGHSWTVTCVSGFDEQWALTTWRGVNTGSPFAAGPSMLSQGSTTTSFASITSPGAGSRFVGLLIAQKNVSSKVDNGTLTKLVESSCAHMYAPCVHYTDSVAAGATSTYTGSVGFAFEVGTVAMILNPASSGQPAAKRRAGIPGAALNRGVW